jgi:hypothetical protein
MAISMYFTKSKRAIGVSTPSDPVATAAGRADALRQEAYRAGKSEQRNTFVKLDAADRD